METSANESILDRCYRKALLLGHGKRKLWICLFLLGLFIRAAGMFGLGDGDMEHFKAWAALTHRYGLARTYSVPDAELVEAAGRDQISLVESFNRNRTWITVEPLAFDTRDYMVVYPPGSIYVIHLSATLYKLVSGGLENSRLFHAFLNFPMVLASFGCSVLIFYFLKERNRGLAAATALFYWLHPIVLLDSTVHGYNNPLIALLILASMICLYRRHYLAANCLAVIALLVKPQGILLIPIVAAVSWKEKGLRRALVYSAAACLAGVLFLAPFLWSGFFLSSLLGATFAVRSLDEWTVPVLSARSWNLWWPLHVATYRLLGVETTRLPEFSQRFGVNPKTIATVLLLGICAASLAFMLQRLQRDRIYIFLALGMFGYAYAMVQVNVQYNQFFVFIPPLILSSLLSPRLFSATTKVSWPWFFQLLAYGGLGRDLCCGAHIFSYFGLNKAYTAGTLLVAAANAWIWLAFCRQYFAGKFNAGPASNDLHSDREPERVEA